MNRSIMVNGRCIPRMVTRSHTERFAMAARMEHGAERIAATRQKQFSAQAARDSRYPCTLRPRFPMGFSMANGLSSTMSSERSACGLLIERNSMGLRWSGTRVAIVFAKRNTTREYPPGSTGNGRRKENSWRATHFALGDCFRSTVRRMTTAMSNQRAATCSPAIALQPTSGGGTAM